MQRKSHRSNVGRAAIVPSFRLWIKLCGAEGAHLRQVIRFEFFAPRQVCRLCRHGIELQVRHPRWRQCLRLCGRRVRQTRRRKGRAGHNLARTREFSGLALVAVVWHTTAATSRGSLFYVRFRKFKLSLCGIVKLAMLSVGSSLPAVRSATTPFSRVGLREMGVSVLAVCGIRAPHLEQSLLVSRRCAACPQGTFCFANISIAVVICPHSTLTARFNFVSAF